METMFSNGMCRCCASEGTFKDLSTKYRWMGVDEVYSDMLQECFNVTLSTPEDSPEGGICEVCITQLRNAANFRKQVLNTEEQFKRMIQNKAFKSNIVKVEVNAPDDELPLTDEDNNLSNDDFSSTEYDLPIKTESSEEGKSRKRSAKAGPSRSKQPKLEGESSTKRICSETKIGIRVIDTTVNVIKMIKTAKIKTEGDWTVSIQKKRSGIKTVTSRPIVKVKEMDKHRQNLVEILLNTNATPIRTFDGLGYTCSFCSNGSFRELRELKKHTLEQHKDSDKKKFMENHPPSGYLVKLDVTSFQCILCGKNILALEEMMKHLISEHNRTLYTDIKNRMLPFNFEDGVFDCVVCRKKTEHFKVMQEHLNVHYGSFYCDQCSAPFMLQRGLRGHVRRHKQGEKTYPCPVCSKVFDTIPRRDAHAKAVHRDANKRNKCPICSEKFQLHYKRQEHMVREHGMEPKLYKCLACDKSFVSKSMLNMHRRRDHLLERRHECQECGKKFFATKVLKYHMLSHTGAKEFQCDVCLKSYGRKTTLREHMRIHKDDRRFKCEHCEQAFVQKCSWKGHMKSKHGIIVNYN